MKLTRMTTIELNAMAVLALVIMGAPALHAAIRAVPGEQRRWALDFRMRLEQPGGERPIEIDLSGDWISTISSVRPGEYVAELQLSGAEMSGEGFKSVPPEAKEQMRRRLARPFWAIYGADGSLRSFHFYKDMSPSDRNLLQTIATETQFVDTGARQPAWTVLERDGAGQYLAEYSRPNTTTVVKRKLKYLHKDEKADVPADRVRIVLDRSELRFSLDRDGVIAALDGVNRARIGVPLGNAGQLTAITETHLSGLRRNQNPDLAGSLERVLPKVESSPVVTHQPDPEESRARLDEQLLQGHTTESLLKAALVKGDDPMLSDRLAALFRRRPEALAAALVRLRNNGAQKRITDALGAAGSPAAIGVLGTVAKDGSLPPSLRIDALTALMLVKNPTPEAMRTPAFLLDDRDTRVASAARMMSGALARAGRAIHQPDADAVDAALIARYRSAHEPGEIADLLAAFGNSGGLSVLPAIEDALRHREPVVRAAAARALRLFAGPEVDGLLAATIQDDHDPGVRAAAIFAAGFRHPTQPILVEALVTVAKSDSAESVRSSAISLLAQNRKAFPRIAETIAWIARNDPKEAVRRLAQEVLNRTQD
jgi:hypothetical protein